MNVVVDEGRHDDRAAAVDRAVDRRLAWSNPVTVDGEATAAHVHVFQRP